MRSMIVAVTLAGLAGCAEDVSVEPLGDYTTWKRIDVTGKVPGHSDSYRIIYINDIAADPTASLDLGYPLGSIVVKEIRANVDGEPGDLDYIAIMRRTTEVTSALVDDGGWLYTSTDSIDDSEKRFGFCWARCHAAAPYNGAFLDYRK